MKRSPVLLIARLGALILYAAAALSLVLLSFLLSPQALQRGIVLQLGLAGSLLALPILALQPLLSARLRWLDRLFGLDRIYRFHRNMAIAAGLLIFAHPLMLALDFQDFSLLTGFQWPWYVTLGKLGFAVLLLLVLGSLLHRLVHRSYERWRRLHNLLALVLLGVGSFHAWRSGRDLIEAPMRIALLALLGIGAASYLGHKLFVPILLRRKSFRVAALRPECVRVWTLSLEPEAGAPPLRHLPGQFQFLTLLGSRGSRGEEHPFTISSWCPAAGPHESTIKESGDYTATIGRTLVQTRALVQGPFGRFSYVLHPDERDFVFLAGGIGITPFISMLRHMEQTRQTVPVLLLYANRSEPDIAFRAELDRIARGGRPRLRVVHALEQPPEGWRGEKGRLDRGMIERHLEGGVSGKAFYVCGPPPMMRALLGVLRRMGVPRRRLHWERFAL